MSRQITPSEAPSEMSGDGRFFLPDKLVDRPEGEVLRQAEKGDARHQYLFALEDWFSDIHSAVKWCRKAADQGYAPAQCFLGFLYGNEYLTFPGYDLAESAK
jgi:TPR repeat protein